MNIVFRYLHFIGWYPNNLYKGPFFSLQKGYFDVKKMSIRSFKYAYKIL